MFLRNYFISPEFSSLNAVGKKIPLGGLMKTVTLRGLSWSGTPTVFACGTLLLPQTKAPGTRLSALGLDPGARFRVSTQLSARLCPLPGLHAGPAASWHLLHVNRAFSGATWRHSSYLSVGHGATGLLGGCRRILGQLCTRGRMAIPLQSRK